MNGVIIIYTIVLLVFTAGVYEVCKKNDAICSKVQHLQPAMYGGFKADGLCQ